MMRRAWRNVLTGDGPQRAPAVADTACGRPPDDSIVADHLLRPGLHAGDVNPTITAVSKSLQML
jgi:hypothetical protein